MSSCKCGISKSCGCLSSQVMALSRQLSWASVIWCQLHQLSNKGWSWDQTGSNTNHIDSFTVPLHNSHGRNLPINSLASGKCNFNSKSMIFKHIIVAGSLIVKLLSGECHRTSQWRNQHLFRWWLGAVRRRLITWANVHPDLSPYCVTRPQWVNSLWPSDAYMCQLVN